MKIPTQEELRLLSPQAVVVSKHISGFVSIDSPLGPQFVGFLAVPAGQIGSVFIFDPEEAREYARLFVELADKVEATNKERGFGG